MKRCTDEHLTFTR